MQAPRGASRRDLLLGAAEAELCCRSAAANCRHGQLPSKIEIYNHVMPLPYLELMKEN